jgi:hypothetical protein
MQYVYVLRSLTDQSRYSIGYATDLLQAMCPTGGGGAGMNQQLDTPQLDAPQLDTWELIHAELCFDSRAARRRARALMRRGVPV